jgi:amino acid adenylation domain-containing protein
MPDSAPRTLRSGFLESCERFPERIALEVADQRLCYRELKNQAAALAATLARHDTRRSATAEDGTAPSALTAIFGHRSPATFAGILGALLRGDGYVPLNPTLPPDRTRSMLERSGCRAVIVDGTAEKQLSDVLDGFETSLLLILPDRDDVSELADRFPRHRILSRLDLEAASGWQPSPVDENAVAYLLFTSGSTGIPKGVKVAHRNVVAFMDAMRDRYGVDENDRFSQTFELTFDLSVFDMFLAWSCGARLCVPSQAQKMLPAKYIQESEITVWFSVPSTGVMMNKLRMLKPNAYPSLRWSLFCGEALPVEIVEAWTAAAPNSIVENLYGPTELTIACTLYRWDPEHSREECEMGLVPIGTPYPNMTVLVVDEALEEVGEGETGELLMAGTQRTPGYWNDPERTAAAYLTPPGRDQIYYRTGDRVRRARGSSPMVYLGRMDNQIKIQGYRVELGEIEAAMRELAGVEVAIALGWPLTAAGADSVVVFLADPDIDASALQQRAKARLPSYMAPREIRIIAEFPLNSNGKVDRKALQALLESA